MFPTPALGTITSFSSRNNTYCIYFSILISVLRKLFETIITTCLFGTLNFFLLCSSYQICEFMYEREHQYDKIIDCYLRDPLREVS